MQLCGFLAASALMILVRSALSQGLKPLIFVSQANLWNPAKA